MSGYVTIREMVKLPRGKVCGDCVFFSRCDWLFQCKPESTSCDWAPSRFKDYREKEGQMSASVSRYSIFVQVAGEADFARVEAAVSDFNGKPLSVMVSFGRIVCVAGVSPIKAYQPGVSETLFCEENPEIADLIYGGIWNLEALSAFLDEFSFEEQPLEVVRVGTLNGSNPDQTA